MFGKMLKNYRHAAVIFGVMLVLSAGTVVWSVIWDTQHPNPASGRGSHAVPKTYLADGRLNRRWWPAVDTLVARDPDKMERTSAGRGAGLPLDQSLGNLEGKELRFGTSAGATLAALTPHNLQRFGQLHAR